MNPIPADSLGSLAAKEIGICTDENKLPGAAIEWVIDVAAAQIRQAEQSPCICVIHLVCVAGWRRDILRRPIGCALLRTTRWIASVSSRVYAVRRASTTPGTATEGEAFFLMMEAAHRDLASAE